MGANYLLGGEEQEEFECCSFLKRKRKTQTNKQQTCPCLLQGKNSKQDKPARFTNKLTQFHVKFYCLALENSGQELDLRHQRLQRLVNDAVQTLISAVGEQHKHQRPLLDSASPSRVVLKRQEWNFDENCYVCRFLVFAFINAPRLLPYVNHSSIFTFSSQHRLPPPSKNNKTKYLL